MRKMISVLILSVLFSLALSSITQADDSTFSWHVDCTEVVNGQNHVWIGYTSSSDLPDSNIEYLGNGPGIYMTDFLSGEHDKVLDIIVDYGSVTVGIDPQAIYITVDSNTTGPDCSTYTPTGAPDMAPNGIVNNPEVNPDANTCYGKGQDCTTTEEWVDGWYRIRKEYGLL